MIEQRVITLATKKGFNNEQLQMLDLFWEPAFNKSWMYVSEEMVSEHMGFKKTKDMMTNFYKQTMIPSLVKNVDYREVTGDDPIVTAYYYSFLKTNIIQGSKPGRPKKYYIISGEAFKQLLMLANTKQGKATRLYYLKVEELAVEMTQILQSDLIEQIELKAQEQVIQAKQEALEQIKQVEKYQNETIRRFKILEQEVLAAKIQKEKQEYIYIMTSLQYGRRGLFKIGRSKCLKNRQASLDTSHTPDDPFVILYSRLCYSNVDLEHRIKEVMKNLRHSTKKEFYFGPFELLKDRVDAIAERHDSDVEDVNEDYEPVMESQQEEDYDYLEGVDMSVFDAAPKPRARSRTKKPTESVVEPEQEPKRLPEQRDVGYDIVTKAIDAYAEANKIDYKYVEDSRTKQIIIGWKSFIPFLQDLTPIAKRDIMQWRSKLFDMKHKLGVQVAICK